MIWDHIDNSAIKSSYFTHISPFTELSTKGTHVYICLQFDFCEISTHSSTGCIKVPIQ